VARALETIGEDGPTKSVRRIFILRAAIYNTVATLNACTSKNRKRKCEQIIEDLQKELDVLEDWDEYTAPLAWWFDA
jgi:hypothetical protein